MSPHLPRRIDDVKSAIKGNDIFVVWATEQAWAAELVPASHRIYPAKNGFTA
jgi:hypothetical protein